MGIHGKMSSTTTKPNFHPGGGTRDTVMADGVEDPYPSLSDFHDYEPNLEFDDSDLLQQKHPENDDELELPEVDRQHTPNTYIESPMSDGTIEEDFEQALAREIADRRGSGEHVVNAGNMTVEGSLEDDDFSDIARHGIVE